MRNDSGRLGWGCQNRCGRWCSRRARQWKEVERRRKDRVTPGGHNGDLYAVLGESRVAFFEMKRSILQRKSLGQLLQSAISNVANCDFTPSRMGASDISLELQDDTTYPLQVARVNRSRGEAFSTGLAERPKS